MTFDTYFIQAGTYKVQVQNSYWSTLVQYIPGPSVFVSTGYRVEVLVPGTVLRVLVPGRPF